MAQTHGRDIINDFDKVNWDRSYVEKISLWTDMKLIFSTFFKVAKCEGFAESCEVVPGASPKQEKPKMDAVYDCINHVE